MMQYLILENIRSAHNVGAMFRTADGAGVSKIFLCGYTPTPIDRFGRLQPEIEKTSLGAGQTMSWEQVAEASQVVRQLQTDGVQTIAIEQSNSSVSLPEVQLSTSVAYIMGNEVDGVSTEVLNQVDIVADLPMLGKKESLNVATAAGIVLYHGIL